MKWPTNNPILLKALKVIAFMVILGGAWYGFILLKDVPAVDTLSAVLMVWTTAFILLMAVLPSLFSRILSFGRTGPEASQTSGAPQAFFELKNYLDSNIGGLKLQGRMTLFITLLVSIILYIDIKLSLPRQLELLEASEHPNQTLAYLIFRSSALGVIATTTLYFGARVTIASFDQAMRFTKRKMGAIFLEYLYEQHDEQLKKDPVTLVQIMASFEVWSKTVESAFSNIKTEKGDTLLIDKLQDTKSKLEKGQAGGDDAGGK